ncbi:histone-lysine N-methyltransferase 2B-like [Drosophila gunungcola]|uniref:histone-lysine N-methyltransferase 2B-like n=1 Tax=Drosophila gunungcola TaxID=103775 RepID=UPI0022E48427|nr:histone-lysine N-methyltransferase 2B-like [Drosophila gunungcola]
MRGRTENSSATALHGAGRERGGGGDGDRQLRGVLGRGRRGAARDRIIFRRLSRATAGLGRICLGQISPSGKPKEWARILEADGHVDVARAVRGSGGGPDVGGGRGHRLAAPTADAPARSKSAKRLAETAGREKQKATYEEEREAQEPTEVLEKGPWQWPTPPGTSRHEAPPPKLARQTSCPEPRAPPARPTHASWRREITGPSQAIKRRRKRSTPRSNSARIKASACTRDQ